MDHLELLSQFGMTPKTLGDKAEQLFAEALVAFRGDAETVYALLDARDPGTSPQCWYYTSNGEENTKPEGEINVADQFVPKGPGVNMVLKMAATFNKSFSRDAITSYIEDQVNNALDYHSLSLTGHAGILVFPSSSGAVLYPVEIHWKNRVAGIYSSFDVNGERIYLADLMQPPAANALPAGTPKPIDPLTANEDWSR